MGVGPFSDTSYFRLNEMPTISSYYTPSTFINSTDRSKVVIDWKKVFTPDSFVTEYAIYFIGRDRD